MAGKYLLDTNIVIALFNGQKSVEDAIAKSSEVFLPSIVVGELYFGAFSSLSVKENLTRLEQFTSSIAILSCDERTALHFGTIKNAIRQKGRPIPDNDLWIGALAKQYHLTLVSRDKHFLEVEQLQLEKW